MHRTGGVTVSWSATDKSNRASASKKQKRTWPFVGIKAFQPTPFVPSSLFSVVVRPRVFVFVFVFARTGQFRRYSRIYCLARPLAAPSTSPRASSTVRLKLATHEVEGMEDGLALVPDLVGSFGHSPPGTHAPLLLVSAVG